MADIDRYRIDPAGLALGWQGEALPLGIVELASLGAESVRLPPFPVVGLGDADDPLAGAVDCVVPDAAAAARLADRIARYPAAAGAAVQLLRAIDGVATEPALTLESFCYAMLQGSAEHAAWLAARASVPAAAPGRLLLARRDERLDVVIDRPGARNAIDRAMRDALSDAFTLATLDPAIRTVTLRATGPAFSVGAELAEFGTTRDPATAHRVRAATLPAHPLARCAGKVRVHVQGACIGAGLEMAAFAARLTASPDAWFQLPELAMGVIPGAGGCVSVPRRIGRGLTALMILSGRRVPAATALAWGLIDAIVDEPPVDPGRADAD